jgi:exopolyphosphatase/guanosine-5'-triphosphate,3'-diphosphate pyrophosphatase
MMIFDTAHSPPVQLLNEKTFCGLGRDLESTGMLNPDGVADAHAILKMYKSVIKERGLQNLDVVGTAALREAADGMDFIRRISEETGFTVRIISGPEEARYAALGVLSLTPDAEGIVGDFGGGSLELARIAQGRISDTVSRPYGAFRALSMGDKAESVIRAGLQDMAPVYADATALHAIGGTWRALAQAFAIDHGGKPKSMQGYTIDASDMFVFCDKIMGFSPEDICRLYNIDDKRSTLAPISAFVLKQVFTVLKPRKMVISLAGIRDGIVYDHLHSLA